MSPSNLFKCYAQDYATLPSSGADISCPILGGQYDKARIKFMAAKEPPEDAPAMFVVRIKGEFTEYPSPRNIEQITQEMRDCFHAQGLDPLHAPKICWRAKPNDMWMDDEHVCPHEHEAYAQIMDQKSHQVVGGEALIAYEIPAEQREKLPAVKAAIDGLIAQRITERGGRVA